MVFLENDPEYTIDLQHTLAESTCLGHAGVWISANSHPHPPSPLCPQAGLQHQSGTGLLE